MVCSECREQGHSKKTCLAKINTVRRISRLNKECSICLSLINKPACETECGHKFHITCLKQWLENNHNCPLCRTEIEEPMTLIQMVISSLLEDNVHLVLMTNPGLIDSVIAELENEYS